MRGHEIQSRKETRWDVTAVDSWKVKHGQSYLRPDEQCLSKTRDAFDLERKLLEDRDRVKRLVHLCFYFNTRVGT